MDGMGRIADTDQRIPIDDTPGIVAAILLIRGIRAGRGRVWLPLTRPAVHCFSAPHCSRSVHRLTLSLRLTWRRRPGPA
jgi:hypothetical protein